jgi:hypothetical protein
MLILSPSRLVNGNNHYPKQINEPNLGLPPPEIINESIKKKKKKRFGRRRKKVEIDNAEHTLNPPRFSQMADRALSFGDNSFDADNAAYNLYAFVVRINPIYLILDFFNFLNSVIMELLVVDIMYHLLKIVRLNNGIVLMIVHAK